VPDDSQFLKQFAFNSAENWPSSIQVMTHIRHQTDQGTETQTDAAKFFTRSRLEASLGSQRNFCLSLEEQASNLHRKLLKIN